MNGRRLLLVFSVLAFIIFISIFIFSIDWGGQTDKPLQDTAEAVNIADYYNSNIDTRMIIRGQVNNNLEHRQLTITVGRSNTTGQIIDGYENVVSITETTPSNPNSYKNFLSALNNSGFLSRKVTAPVIQYEGACPRGLRYTFEFIGGDKNTPKSLWATSCGKKIGTFAGDIYTIKNLFYAQLPKDQLIKLTANNEF